MKHPINSPASILTPEVMARLKKAFVPQPAAALPLVHVRIKVTQFRDVLTVTKGSPLSDFQMRLLTEHPNAIQTRDDRIEVKNAGAIFHFSIEDKAGEHPYLPVAMTFTRERPPPAAAVFWNGGNQSGVTTPFSNLQLNGHTLQITDTLGPLGFGHKRPALYKFSIIIQRHTAGGGDPAGAIGILDPYFENDNEC